MDQFTIIILLVAALIILGVVAIASVFKASDPINFIETLDDRKYFDDDYKGPWLEENDTFTLWYAFDQENKSNFIVTKALPTRGFYWINPAGIKAWHMSHREEQPFRISYEDLVKNFRPETEYDHDKYAMPQN